MCAPGAAGRRMQGADASVAGLPGAGLLGLTGALSGMKPPATGLPSVPGMPPMPCMPGGQMPGMMPNMPGMEAMMAAMMNQPGMKEMMSTMMGGQQAAPAPQPAQPAPDEPKGKSGGKGFKGKSDFGKGEFGGGRDKGGGKGDFGKDGPKGGGRGGSSLAGWMLEDIQDLCDKFQIDDRLQRRLTERMESREDTFKEDMRSLTETLETARNPPGLLSVKMREMEDGTFVPKGGGKGGDRGKGKGSFNSRFELSPQRSRSRSKSRRRRRSRSRSNRSRSKRRGKDKAKDKDRDKDRDRDRDRDRDKDKDRDKKDRKDKEKERSRERGDKDKDRKKDKEKKDKDKKEPEKQIEKDPEPDVAEVPEQRERSRSRESRDSTDMPKRPAGHQASPSPERLADNGENGARIAPPQDEDEVHDGIACSGCHMTPIRGDRFKCQTCESFDLCEHCYERKGQIHPGGHRFFKKRFVPGEAKTAAPKVAPAPATPAEQALPPPQMPNMVQMPNTAQMPNVAQMPSMAQMPNMGQMPNMQQMQQMMQQMMMGGMMPGLMPGMPGLPGMPVISEQTMPAAPNLKASPPAVAQAGEPETVPFATEAAPVAKEPPPPPSQPKKEALEWPAWLRFGAPCSICGDASTADAQPHGVICRRRRKNAVGGCGKGVCWVCMEREPRSKFGMVRTTREEFESLEESAWWMHEACMEPSDLRAYFGGEKELAEARAAADASDTKVVPDKAKTKEPGVDPLEAERERIKKMSVKELKAYLDRHNTSHADLFEKPDLLARALEAALKSGPEPPPGPAWMKSGDICRLCGKPQMQDEGGIFCRRRRQDGRIAGCGEAICWRCMKRAPKDAFGKVRCTKEEFAGLGEDAWWMHQHCFEDGDWQDYFGEPEPEEERWRRTGESNW